MCIRDRYSSVRGMLECSQRATLSADIRIYKGSVSAGGVSGWHQVNTDVRTPFTVTPAVGNSINSQDCYVQNGRAYIYVDMVKSDSTEFTTNANLTLTNSITNSPSGIIPNRCSGFASNGSFAGLAESYTGTDGSLILRATQSGVFRVRIKTEFTVGGF